MRHVRMCVYGRGGLIVGFVLIITYSFCWCAKCHGLISQVKYLLHETINYGGMPLPHQVRWGPSTVPQYQIGVWLTALFSSTDWSRSATTQGSWLCMYVTWCTTEDSTCKSCALTLHTLHFIYYAEGQFFSSCANFIILLLLAGTRHGTQEAFLIQETYSFPQCFTVAAHTYTCTRKCTKDT